MYKHNVLSELLICQDRFLLQDLIQMVVVLDVDNI